MTLWNNITPVVEKPSSVIEKIVFGDPWKRDVDNSSDKMATFFCYLSELKEMNRISLGPDGTNEIDNPIHHRNPIINPEIHLRKDKKYIRGTDFSRLENIPRYGNGWVYLEHVDLPTGAGGGITIVIRLLIVEDEIDLNKVPTENWPEVDITKPISIEEFPEIIFPTLPSAKEIKKIHSSDKVAKIQLSNFIQNTLMNPIISKLMSIIDKPI